MKSRRDKLRALTANTIGIKRGCNCRCNVTDGGDTSGTDCADWCNFGDGFTCSNNFASTCFEFDLSEYFNADTNCPYALWGKYQLWYTGSCQWWGPYCDPAAGPTAIPPDNFYGNCRCCYFKPGVDENTTGEGTITFSINMRPFCAGLPMQGYNAIQCPEGPLNEFGINDGVGSYVSTSLMGLSFFGDSFNPFICHYKQSSGNLTTFRCRGVNSFTKVWQNSLSGYTFPTTITLKPAVCFNYGT